MSKSIVSCFLPLLLGLSVLGCGSGSGSDSCTPGRSVACDCKGGETSVQICLEDNTFGPCDCPDGQPAGPDGGGVERPDSGGTTKGSGPHFLSFGTSATSLTEGESVTFSAVLSDPDGIDDLIGGTLMSADGQAKYGSFATSGQEGAYAITVSWNQMNQSSPIDFTTEATRGFIAEFYDVAGHRTTKNVELRLHCGGLAACAGKHPTRFHGESSR